MACKEVSEGYSLPIALRSEKLRDRIFSSPTPLQSPARCTYLPHYPYVYAMYMREKGGGGGFIDVRRNPRAADKQGEGQ